MRYALNEQQCRNVEVSTRREWILTNGIGGYAMGTAAGVNTRRYHGHLVAATTPPTGRMVLLAAIDAFIEAGGSPMGISANQYPGTFHPEGFHYLRGFSVDSVAIWRFRAAGLELEKRVAMHPGENAVTVEYENVGKTPLHLTLRPLVCHRDHHGDFFEHPQYPDRLLFPPNETVVESQGVPLHLRHLGASRSPVTGWYYRFEHEREAARGLNSRGDLFCPCELTYDLGPGEKAVLVAGLSSNLVPISIEVEPPAREFRIAPMLQEAASRFVISTGERSTIIAGYPWFTDWGRDVMISLPGICLHTGNVAIARQILTDYSSQLRNGLIPNRFVEVGEEPDYNTVDATLWFANAIYNTLLTEWDETFAVRMLDALREIVRWHLKGTQFGIGVDPADGLLRQGEPGVQLTWMDAKVGDWVITPRHGKPVEINGLWINALRVTEWLASKLGADPLAFREAAEAAEASFERKFWHEMRGHYLDTADPADASLRPNQVIAMALPFTCVDPDHARRALGVVTRELLTLNGLRTLGPKEAGYQGQFSGGLPELDSKYHQGTVWPWLLGSYVTALVRFTGDRVEAKRVLRNVRTMVEDYGLGGVAEVYDGDEPQSPNGCPWQAWSLAEILRAWMEDVGGD
jgi:predicted glycogen debranching enzyme